MPEKQIGNLTNEDLMEMTIEELIGWSEEAHDNIIKMEESNEMNPSAKECNDPVRIEQRTILETFLDDIQAEIQRRSELRMKMDTGISGAELPERIMGVDR